MGLPFPSKGEPLDPRDTDQVDRDMVVMKQNPEVGPTDFKKLAPGELAGRIKRIGKSLKGWAWILVPVAAQFFFTLIILMDSLWDNVA